MSYRIKKVCRHCKKGCGKIWYRDKNYNMKKHGWGVSEGILWEQHGRVICPYQGEPNQSARQIGRSIWEKPPDECPFILEHMLGHRNNG
jgi:hypothetical protein